MLLTGREAHFVSWSVVLLVSCQFSMPSSAVCRWPSSSALLFSAAAPASALSHSRPARAGRGMSTPSSEIVNCTSDTMHSFGSSKCSQAELAPKLGCRSGKVPEVVSWLARASRADACAAPDSPTVVVLASLERKNAMAMIVRPLNIPPNSKDAEKLRKPPEQGQRRSRHVGLAERSNSHWTASWKIGLTL